MGLLRKSHKRRSCLAQGMIKKKIKYDRRKTIDVWTDASFTQNGSKRYAGLGIFWGENHPNNLAHPIVVRGRHLATGDEVDSTMAEVMAAGMAMMVASAQGITKLRINTDSYDVIRALSDTPKSARSGGRRLFKRLKNKTSGIKMCARDWMSKFVEIKFVKVRGHAGVKQNLIADQLARQAMKEARQQSPRHPIHAMAIGNECACNYLQSASSTHTGMHVAFGSTVFTP